MSDEIHMESAWRHRDLTAREQWHGAAPDEALMEAEEWEAEAEAAMDPIVDAVWLMERVMVYLFSGAELERWENVALRAWALMVAFAPHVAAKRSRREVPLLECRKGINREDSLRNATVMCRESDAVREALMKMLCFIYPGEGRKWLERGTQRAYLLAREYQPGLISGWHVDPRYPDGERIEGVLTLENLAEIFDGKQLTNRKERNLARSRWSARAQVVLAKPIQASGGSAGLRFSKSATAREKMRESAKGNQNRRGMNVTEHPTAGAAGGQQDQAPNQK